MFAQKTRIKFKQARAEMDRGEDAGPTRPKIPKLQIANLKSQQARKRGNRNGSASGSLQGGDNGKVASAHPAEAPRVYICADGERLCHLRFKVGGVAEKVLEVRGKMRLVSAPSEEEDEAEEDAAARKRGRGEKDEEDGAAQKGAADVVEELLILSLRESAEALRFEAERA